MTLTGAAMRAIRVRAWVTTFHFSPSVRGWRS